MAGVFTAFLPATAAVVAVALLGEHFTRGACGRLRADDGQPAAGDLAAAGREAMRAWFACTGRGAAGARPARHRRAPGRRAAGARLRRHARTRAVAWDAADRGAARRRSREAGGAAWTIALEYDLLRLEKRIDAVVLTDRAILAAGVQDRGADHRRAWPRPRTTRSTCATSTPAAAPMPSCRCWSRRRRGGFAPPRQPWLLPTHPTEPLVCGHAGLGALLRWVQAELPAPRDAARRRGLARRRPIGPCRASSRRRRCSTRATAWPRSPRRAPTPPNLTRTTRGHRARRRGGAARRRQARGLRHRHSRRGQDALRAERGLRPRRGGRRRLPDRQCRRWSTVLREALARDAVARARMRRGRRRSAARRRALQNVHRFLEDNATDPDAPRAARPPDRLRRGAARLGRGQGPHSARATSHRRLTMSEPAHTLEIMGRHAGLGRDRRADRQRAGDQHRRGRARANGAACSPADRRAGAPPRRRARWRAEDPVQRLAEGAPAWLAIDDDLDLTVPMRSVREHAGARLGGCRAARRGAEARGDRARRRPPCPSC